MKLYATPRSHFARKVRIVLEHYQIPFEFIDIGNVIQTDPSAFGKNPMMKVPTLVDGDNWLIESDHIVQYIVNKHDPSDKLGVHMNSVLEMNIRAVLNEIMQEEVKIVLGKRTQIPIEKYSFFDKALMAIKNGLQWLEENYSASSGELKYRDIHLVCLWEHLGYNEITSLEGYPKLANVVKEKLEIAALKKSSPYLIS